MDGRARPAFESRIERSVSAKFHPPTAFPVNFEFTDDAGVTQKHVGLGMTLRDYFAAAALAMASDAQTLIAIRSQARHDDRPAEELVANWAFGIADAMLKAREK